mmetsp:Transcript_3764/g.9541  ORF Transcript_3764/g.9541 Transcript_3764/m.9541 type:complete len:331 (+) Transcript_3764:1570-2562(+)
MANSLEANIFLNRESSTSTENPASSPSSSSCLLLFFLLFLFFFLSFLPCRCFSSSSPSALPDANLASWLLCPRDRASSCASLVRSRSSSPASSLSVFFLGFRLPFPFLSFGPWSESSEASPSVCMCPSTSPAPVAKNGSSKPASSRSAPPVSASPSSWSPLPRGFLARLSSLLRALFSSRRFSQSVGSASSPRLMRACLVFSLASRASRLPSKVTTMSPPSASAVVAQSPCLCTLARAPPALERSRPRRPRLPRTFPPTASSALASASASDEDEEDDDAEEDARYAWMSASRSASWFALTRWNWSLKRFFRCGFSSSQVISTRVCCRAEV